MNFDLLTVIYFVASLLPAIVLHELSHGVVTDRLGDPTPRMMGRLTVNPVKHIDPIGTVFLPGILLLPWLFGRPGPVFGYAKPMPLNPSYLRKPDRQLPLIMLVGPLIGVVLAIVTASQLVATEAFGEDIAFIVPWDNLAILTSLALLASLEATAWPAQEASKIPPAVALRLAD